MITRRNILLGSTAVAAMTIISALPVPAATAPSMVPEFVLRLEHIDQAISILARFGLDINRSADAFRLELHNPRTENELRQDVELFAFTYGDEEMRSRIRSIVEIGEGMERRFPGLAPRQIQWLARTQPIHSYDCFDFIRTGNPGDLQLVSIVVNSA